MDDLCVYTVFYGHRLRAGLSTPCATGVGCQCRNSLFTSGKTGIPNTSPPKARLSFSAAQSVVISHLSHISFTYTEDCQLCLKITRLNVMFYSVLHHFQCYFSHVVTVPTYSRNSAASTISKAHDMAPNPFTIYSRQRVNQPYFLV